MAGLINLKLLADFFNKIGPYATFTHVRLGSGMRGRTDMPLLTCHLFSYCRTTWRKFSAALRLVARL